MAEYVYKTEALSTKEMHPTQGIPLHVKQIIFQIMSSHVHV